jgi:glycosyltransferase involved in cell wall biosynthesis
MSKLAIVIPAYKSKFLGQSILSIVNQTNRDFTLYIGDDCSPDNLYSVVEKYESLIPIVYKHFDENLGKKDLVAQWERCIDLVGDEEWIWLFADDDLMDVGCVEYFYQSLRQNPDSDLFHFNVEKIDEFNNPTISQFMNFPGRLSSEEFLIRKLQGGYFSTVVEYIFRKMHFYENGRFNNFDLGWGSDDALWIKLSRRNGIRTIEESKVYWRQSKINISSDQDEKIVIRKFYAQIEFSKWIYTQVKNNEIHFEIHDLKFKLITWFVGSIKSRISFFPFHFINPMLSKVYEYLYEQKPPNKRILYLYSYKIYRYILEKYKQLPYRDFFNTSKQKFQSIYLSF